MISDSHYRGPDGRAYFALRAPRRTRDAQAVAARVFFDQVRPEDGVLDFGCGTGGILAAIPCARRVGIEVNEPSAVIARELGIEVHPDLGSIAGESVDVAIAHHSLEHVPDPLGVLRRLCAVVRPGGKLIVVVPAESDRDAARPGSDLNRHLFSWTRKTLANLVQEAGFSVKETYRAQAGYSHYIAWLAPLPTLLLAAESAVAFILRRYQNVCVAERPLPPAHCGQP